MVGHDNVRVQGVWGDSKMRSPGGTGLWLGMVSHQRQESHANKGDSTSNVQSRFPRYFSRQLCDTGLARFLQDGTYFREIMIEAGIIKDVIW